MSVVTRGSSCYFKASQSRIIPQGRLYLRGLRPTGVSAGLVRDLFLMTESRNNPSGWDIHYCGSGAVEPEKSQCEP